MNLILLEGELKEEVKREGTFRVDRPLRKKEV